MLIAGEASGDLLAAELVSALRAQLPDAKFFGAGGVKMAEAVPAEIKVEPKMQFVQATGRMFRDA